MARIANNIQCDQESDKKLHNYKLAVVFLLPAYPVALCLARGEPIVDNKTTRISTMTLKEGISRNGVKLWWYPRKEFTALSEKQKHELREFTNPAAE